MLPVATDQIMQAQATMTHALELKAISKSFDGKEALRKASFNVRWGEVHALLGENGAGKSTIMNVATGIYSPDEGSVHINEQPVAVRSPGDAIRHGIGMVHQHYRLVKRFSVAENIVLACGDIQNLTSTSAAASAVAEKAAEVGFDVSAHAIVGQLSIAEQQRVEILKVLLLGASIIILDEPTAVLTDQESRAILAFCRRMAEAGHAVVLITHKLREVLEFSDRVTVMRHGETVLDGADTSGLDVDILSRHMIGEPSLAMDELNASLGDPCLTVSNLVVPSPNGTIGVEGISVSVREGEILGIAGVGGNGQQQLADALMGLTACENGSIRLGENDITNDNVTRRRQAGLRAVPADRFASGLIADMTIAENLAMTRLADGEFGGYFTLSRRTMRKEAEDAISDHDIRGAAPTRQTRLLSGGNAQKLLLARELSGSTRLLVAHSPTRGLDIKACNTVHSLIRKFVESGAACLLISEDLEEILTLSTRVAVISRGKVVGEFPKQEATPEKIGALMMGHA